MSGGASFPASYQEAVKSYKMRRLLETTITHYISSRVAEFHCCLIELQRRLEYDPPKVFDSWYSIGPKNET